MHRTSVSDIFHSGGSSSHSKLCFEPTEFHSDAFSIDEFIQRKRQVVPLDVLRDDLGAYLKALRSSLIELINHDYGQFVNLSSNLVGLDSQIYNITKPLKVVQRDLEALRDHLQSTLNAINMQLSEKRLIQGIQKHTQYLRLANTTLESAENYMHQISSCLNSSDASLHNFTHLELVCSEVAQVQFLIEKCSQSLSLIASSGEQNVTNMSVSPFLGEIQTKYQACTSFVFEKLEYLLEFYGSGAVSPTANEEEIEVRVRSLLQMFNELKHEAKAEEIFVNKILKPKCTEVLSRKGNIIALLEDIEAFLTKCPLLIASRQVQSFPWLAHFNFVVNGLFPYLINILVKQFPHIWSPSNPDQFFTHWKRFEVFIQHVEDSLPSAIHLNEFRSSSILNDFISKWQFHVYFQLRFHNLAIELESALDSLLTSPCPTSDFKLDATRVLVKVVSQCWDNEKTFLVQLSGRFLKASALFISRYLREVSTQIKIICDSRSQGQGDTNLSKAVTTPLKTSDTASPHVLKVQQLISIYYDLSLGELTLGQILHENIESILSSQLRVSSEEIERTADVVSSTEFLSQFAWNTTKQDVESNLIQLILVQMTAHINSVNEVPRLFRRTNRDVPTNHSDYVDTMLEPLVSFESVIRSQYDSNHKSDLWNRVVESLSTQLAQRYANQVQEVLTSVQRMEESLKRLKKVKAGGGGGGANDTQLINAVNNNARISDDDKIRKQIRIDVEYLISKLQTLSPAIDTAVLQNITYA